MGKHVAETVHRTPAQFVLASRSERVAHAWGPGTINKIGRHAQLSKPACTAYVLVEGKRHYCATTHVDAPAQHSHPIYGRWNTDVWDLDVYRKRFVR